MATTFHGTPPADEGTGIKQFLGVFRYGKRALELVWSTSKALTIAFGLLTLLAGIIPAGIAYVGQKIVDAVVAAAAATEPDMQTVMLWVGVEAGLVIAMAAMQAANRLSNVSAIIAMTETGNTPRLMSRLRSGMPIFAFTPTPATQRRVAILRGVQAIAFDSTALPSESVNHEAVAILEKMGHVKSGDRVLITKGNYADAHGGTNTLKIVEVGGKIQ